MKKTLLLFISITMLILPGCSLFQKETSKEEIVEYVETHNQVLVEHAVNREWDKNKDLNDIKEVFGKDCIVELIYYPLGNSRKIVCFECHGSGLATNSVYVGFYYSADDTTYPIIFANSASLSETGTDVYEWENEDGMEKLYTERIRENWFYYWVQWF